MKTIIIIHIYIIKIYENVVSNLYTKKNKKLIRYKIL